MSNVINISLLQRLDSAEIDAGGIKDILLLNEYDGGLAEDAVIAVADLDSTTLAAFKTVNDFLTWQFEANCPVIKVKYTPEDKEFDLRESYLRDVVDTDAVAALDDETPVKVRFEFPGFEENTFIDVTAFYKSDFDPDDIAALAAAGITITGDGAHFTISTTRECRVFFSKPDDAETNYVIYYPAALTIIHA